MTKRIYWSEVKGRKRKESPKMRWRNDSGITWQKGLLLCRDSDNR